MTSTTSTIQNQKKPSLLSKFKKIFKKKPAHIEGQDQEVVEKQSKFKRFFKKKPAQIEVQDQEFEEEQEVEEEQQVEDEQQNWLFYLQSLSNLRALSMADVYEF